MIHELTNAQAPLRCSGMVKWLPCWPSHCPPFQALQKERGYQYRTSNYQTLNAQNTFMFPTSRERLSYCSVYFQPELMGASRILQVLSQCLRLNRFATQPTSKDSGKKQTKASIVCNPCDCQRASGGTLQRGPKFCAIASVTQQSMLLTRFSMTLSSQPRIEKSAIRVAVVWDGQVSRPL